MKSQKFIHSPFLARGGETGGPGSLVPSGTRNNGNKIRPLEENGKNRVKIDKPRSGQKISLGTRNPIYFSRNTESSVDYRSIHSARINGN